MKSMHISEVLLEMENDPETPPKFRLALRIGRALSDERKRLEAEEKARDAA